MISNIPLQTDSFNCGVCCSTFYDFILKARADRANNCRDNNITKLMIEFDSKEFSDFFDEKRQEIHDIVKDLP